MANEKFKAWVKSYGVIKLASDIGVHRSTVSRWIWDNMPPSDSHRLSILKLAGKKLKLGDIVSGF